MYETQEPGSRSRVSNIRTPDSRCWFTVTWFWPTAREFGYRSRVRCSKAQTGRVNPRIENEEIWLAPRALVTMALSGFNLLFSYIRSPSWVECSWCEYAIVFSHHIRAFVSRITSNVFRDGNFEINEMAATGTLSRSIRSWMEFCCASDSPRSRIFLAECFRSCRQRSSILIREWEVWRCYIRIFEVHRVTAVEFGN